MTVEYRNLLSRVLVEAPQCPEDVAIAALRDASRELCRSSEIWRQSLSPITLVPKRAEVTLSPPTGASVMNVLSLLYQGEPLEKTTEEALNATSPDWFEREGPPQAFLHLEHNQVVRFVPIPKKTEVRAVRPVRVSLQPARDATNIPDHIAEEYDETICHGALGRILANPDAPWSAPNLATYYAREFSAAVTNARIRANRGQGTASLRVQPRGHQFVGRQRR